MKALTPGHLYELDNFERELPGAERKQKLQFIEKIKGDNGAALVTKNNGTTNEEVLAMLIDRLKFLYAKLSSPPTQKAIGFLEKALHQLERRTKERKKRGVEGTNKP